MLLDTDVLIDYLRGREPVRRFLVEAAASDEPLQTTVVNQFELLAGAKAAASELAVQDLLATLDILLLDSAAAATAGKLR